MEENNLLTRASILDKYCKHYATHTDCPQKEVLKRAMTRLWTRFLENPLALESFYDDLGLEGCGASSTTSSEPEALDLNAPTTPSTQNTETIPRSFEVDERESMRVPDRFSCPICLEEHQVNQSAQCYALMCKEGLHYYCLDCLHSLLIIQDEPKCVLCRQVIPEDEKRQVIRLYEQAHVVVISDDPIEEDEEEEEEEIPLAPPRRTNSNANELAPSGWLSVASLRRDTARGNPERATDRSTKSFRTCSCCHDSALVGQAAIWCNECSHSYNASHFLKVMTRVAFKKCPKCKILGRNREVSAWNYRDFSLTFLSGNRVMVTSRITDDSTPAIKHIKKRATPRGTEWYIDL